MILYKCNRCGKILKNESECFVVKFKPPEVWTYFEGPIKYFAGTMHFCQNCMDKLNECIDELGRSDIYENLSR